MIAGIVAPWWLVVAAGSGAGVVWLLRRAYLIDGPNWPCMCQHARREHDRFDSPSTACTVPGCSCQVYGGMSVHAARRRDVATALRLQPPSRDAIRTYPEFSEAEMDRALDEIIRRGGAQ